MQDATTGRKYMKTYFFIVAGCDVMVNAPVYFNDSYFSDTSNSVCQPLQLKSGNKWKRA